MKLEKYIEEQPYTMQEVIDKQNLMLCRINKIIHHFVLDGKLEADEVDCKEISGDILYRQDLDTILKYNGDMDDYLKSEILEQAVQNKMWGKQL